MTREAPSEADLRVDRWFLLLLAATFVLKGIAFALLVPPWQGPDEPANLGAIERVAQERLDPAAGGEVSEAIKKSVRASDFWKLRAWPQDFDRRDEGGFLVSQSLTLYNFAVLPAYWIGSAGGIEGALYAVRLAGVLLGAGAVVLTFFLARELNAGPRALPHLASALVAFVPQFGFITATVNKDSLAALLGTAILWMTARSASRGLSVRRLLALASLLAAGVLTKPSLVALALPVAVVVALAAFRSGRAAVGLGLSAVGLLALAALGRGRLASVERHFYFAGRAELLESLRTAGRPSVWLYVLPQAWGHFGWVNAPLSPALYVVLFGLTAASAVGVAGFLLLRGRRLAREEPRALVILGGLILAIAAVTVAVMFAQVAFVATQGRFWFPAIGAFAVLFALGLATIAPTLASRNGVLVWVLAGAGLNLVVLLRDLPDRFGVL